jgi:hypothetical protein
VTRAKEQINFHVVFGSPLDIMVACNNDPQQFDPIYTVVINCSSGYMSRPPKGLQKTESSVCHNFLGLFSQSFFATFVVHMENSLFIEAVSVFCCLCHVHMLWCSRENEYMHPSYLLHLFFRRQESLVTVLLILRMGYVFMGFS